MSSTTDNYTMYVAGLRYIEVLLMNLCIVKGVWIGAGSRTSFGDKKMWETKRLEILAEYEVSSTEELEKKYRDELVRVNDLQRRYILSRDSICTSRY